MRVISGTARSLKLKTLEGKDTRPTTDRIKETLFNMIQQDIGDCRFLDLFAGSGAIGIEALSRGAGKACFVEKEKKAVACIRDNLRSTRLEENSSVLQMEANRALRQLEGQAVFDIIFMDPPYQSDLEKEALEILGQSTILDQDGIIIVEAALDTDFSYLSSYGFDIKKMKKYKTNLHIFIQKA